MLIKMNLKRKPDKRVETCTTDPRPTVLEDFFFYNIEHWIRNLFFNIDERFMIWCLKNESYELGIILINCASIMVQVRYDQTI